MIETEAFHIRNDIEMILFDEGRFDMKYYTKMKPIIDELQTLVEIHAGAALDRYKHEVRRELLDTVSDAVKEELYGTRS